MRARLGFLLVLVAAIVPLPAGAFNFAPSEPAPAPDVTFLDGDDNEVTLADFAGRVVVLNFWATWCAPCRREMPSLDRLQATLGGEDLEVIALSTDRGEAQKVHDFYEEVGLVKLGIYRDPKAKSPRAFKALGLPTTIVIDRDGQEIGRLLGPAEWDSAAAIELLQAILAQ